MWAPPANFMDSSDAMHIDNKFSLATSAYVKKLCQPFLNEYQLTSFNYARIYPDKSILALHSDPLFSRLYLELNCPPIPPIPSHYWQYQRFYFLAKTCNEARYQNLLTISGLHTNSDNPLFLIKQNTSYTEVAVFASALGNNTIINRYFNDLGDLNNFVQYFSEKTEPLFAKAHNQRLILPAHLTPDIPAFSLPRYFDSPYDIFYRNLLQRQIYPLKLLKKLSEREIQCLYYLSRGYRYKAIAKQLALSARTIETHINNAKNKLNTAPTTQLIINLEKCL